MDHVQRSPSRQRARAWYLLKCLRYLKCLPGRRISHTVPDGVVIGPTVDGGYYFIGLKAPCRRLFEEIDWGTDRVFEQTRMREAEVDMAQMIRRVIPSERT